MQLIPELVLSCWIIEAARAAVLSGRGHTDAATRSRERAQILASACEAIGIAVVPRFASDHAEWIVQVAGSASETGAIGWFFLQRLGMYVDAHIEGQIPAEDHARLQQLGAPDADEVNAVLAAEGIPASPPPHWPSAERARAPGTPRARIAIIGDPHVGTDASSTLLPVVLAALGREGFDVGVAIGDLTQNGRRDLFERAHAAFESASIPILVTLGNHDMWGGGTAHALGREHFKEIFGRASYAAQELDGCRLVALDSSDPRASPFPPFDLTSGVFTDAPNESVPGGLFSEDTLAWMDSLEPGPPTFVFLHHPPFPYLGFPPLVFGLDEESTKHLTEFAARLGVKGIFCGHTHRCALTSLEGIPVIEVPSIKEWPFGHGVLEVSDEGWSYNLQPIDAPDAVEDLSSGAGLLFRRYAQGPDTARAFSARF